MKKLENKIAVITGATSGMALAAAKLFVAEGAYVFITGRREKELKEAVRSIGSNVTGVLADSGNMKDLDKLYERVKSEKGRIDVLYANAGAYAYVPFDSVSEEQFDELFDLNVRGTFFTVQKALPLLTDGASVIMTGSMVTIKGIANLSVYAATKAALRSFARTWTTDLQSRHIRINVISPGPTETAVMKDMSKETKDAIALTIPRKAIGQPEEIATAALFLASGDSSYITGIELFVDGGISQI
jgi:NAD(P)-dependent dehydrogenase (short-subunit alcohol dehydrogenase family)